MEITRDVILDLLPLYSAGEVSDETRSLIEKYLENDPELAKVAKKFASMDMPKDIPIPLSQDSRIKAYSRARRLNLIIAVLFVGTISVIVIFTMLIFFLKSS